MEEVAEIGEPAANDDEEERQEIIIPNPTEVIPQNQHPSHTVIEVMRRLPVKSLLRFRAVCSSWRDYVDGNEFSLIYPAAASTSSAGRGVLGERSCRVFLWAQARRESPDIPSSSDDGAKTTPSEYRCVYFLHTVTDRNQLIVRRLPWFDMEIELKSDLSRLCRVAAVPCRGLNLLYSDAVVRILHITSKQMLTIPKSKYLVRRRRTYSEPLTSISLGYDDSSKQYHLVRLIRQIRSRGLNAGCEVYMFSTVALWRGATNNKPAYPIDFLTEPVFTRGAHHWLTKEDKGGHRSILAVDIKESKRRSSVDRLINYRLIKLMEYNPQQFSHLKMFPASEKNDVEGINHQICVMGEVSGDTRMIELWKLDHYIVDAGDYRWSKRCRVECDSWEGLCWRATRLLLRQDPCYLYLSHEADVNLSCPHCELRCNNTLWWYNRAAKTKELLTFHPVTATTWLGAAVYEDRSLYGMDALRRERILINRFIG